MATKTDVEKLAGEVRVFLRFAVLAIIIMWLLDLAPRDNTDPATGPRSGMLLHTDAGTGCQYLSRYGGLVPRVDGTGRHMGCKPLNAVPNEKIESHMK